MSDGDVRRVSVQDIQLVQDLIERCLQLYMSQGEVVTTLLQEAKIEPDFTELVWQKLEAENQDFFRGYHMRLIIKDQILRFNELLERQVELSKTLPARATCISPSNGSHIQSTYKAPQPTGLSINPENMFQTIRVVPNAYTNGAMPMQSCMRVGANMMGDTGRIYMPSNTMTVQGSNSVMLQGMNGGITKSEVGYGGDSPFMFGSWGKPLDSHTVIGEGTVPHFDGVEPSSHTVNENTLDPEMTTFGFLNQIHQNFSLSDLPAHFSNSTDTPENYSNFQYLGTEATFIGASLRDDHQAHIMRFDI